MAGAEGAREIRAQAICFDGETLLCARHRRGEAEYWVLPGGHVEPGESLWEALVREMAEETGLVVRKGRLWAVGEFRGADRHVLDVAFWLDAWEGSPALGEDLEGDPGSRRLVGLAWIDRATLERIELRPSSLARRLALRWGEAHAPAEYLGVTAPEDPVGS
ncbi:MAG TPA: NUDIX domain-containing protein [Gemmatimonadota bacterium]|nr:NUDIX domain-containing protein [Gemmatimonadota bacterium]